MDSFLRAAKLRRWLNRPDCPEALRQVKHFFDKAYGSCNFNSTPESDGTTKHHTPTSKPSPSIPADLLPLLPQDDLCRLTLVARCKHEGRTLARSSTHIGNSLILYHTQEQLSAAEYGSIKYIGQVGQRFVLAVRRHLPTSRSDPFKHYPDFPATTRSAQLGPLELIDQASVICHFVRWKMPTGDVVVLPLYKVREVLSILINYSHRNS